MNPLLFGIIAYLLAGAVALGTLDLVTHRVRKRFTDAARETQDKLAFSGTVVGTKQAMVIIALAIWIFWPFTVIGAMVDLFRRG